MRERKNNRLRGFDYAQPGAYFVTTVVKGRHHHFGAVENGTIFLTRYGNILVDQWHWLHKQYPNTALDEFIVTPNHFHGIITIRDRFVGTGRDLSLPADAIVCVWLSTHRRSNPTHRGLFPGRFGCRWHERRSFPARQAACRLPIADLFHRHSAPAPSQPVACALSITRKPTLDRLLFRNDPTGPTGHARQQTAASRSVCY